MEIIKNDYYIELHGINDDGEYIVRIHKDCSQLQIETGLDNAFIDTNLRQLKSIRDAITEIIDLNDN